MIYTPNSVFTRSFLHGLSYTFYLHGLKIKYFLFSHDLNFFLYFTRFFVKAIYRVKTELGVYLLYTFIFALAENMQ